MTDARRWTVLASATGLMVCIGTAYSWSLFTRPLMAYFGWSSLQVGFAFAIMVFGVGFGALAGGILHDRYGARRVGIAGAALWGLGFILAGLGMARFGLPWLYVTYGLIGGFGGGMAYVVPGSCAMRWFPKNRGLVNGVVLFGYGAGALAFNSIVTAFPPFAAVSEEAQRLIAARNAALVAAVPFHAPPALLQGADVLANTFVGIGAILTVAGIACALGLQTAPATPASATDTVHEYPPREMLRTRGFYVMWTIVFVDCFAGLALLGNAVPVYSQLTGASAGVAAVAFGWLSIFNGAGRLMWAWISDIAGRIPSLTAAFVVQGAALYALTTAHSVLGVSCAFAVALLCFGGILAIAPAIMADFYGTKYLGQDYGYIITAASIAGLSGPLLFGAVEDATGSLTRTIAPIGIFVLVSAVLPLLARRPSR